MWLQFILIQITVFMRKEREGTCYIGVNSVGGVVIIRAGKEPESEASGSVCMWGSLGYAPDDQIPAP
jgi:hypothetical protein